MKIEEINKIIVSVDLNKIRILSIEIDKEHNISRQGTGNLPANQVAVIYKSDGTAFAKLVSMLSDNILRKDGLYQHSDTSGLPLNYKIAFIGKESNINLFEFTLGDKTQEVSHLLPFFGNFIQEALQLTNEVYSRVTQQ
jgi:hypothetical protein